MILIIKQRKIESSPGVKDAEVGARIISETTS